MSDPPLSGTGHRLTVVLAILAATTLVLGFLIQWATLIHLGPGIATDALFAALAIPQLLVVVAVNPTVHVLVPLLATEDKPTQDVLAWTIFWGAAGILGIAALALATSSSVWVPLTVAGFPTPGKRLAASLAVIELPGVPLTAMGMVLRSVNHARGKFLWTACSGLLAAAAAFAFLLWSLPRHGVVGAAWSYTLRAGLDMILLLPVLGRSRRPTWSPLVQRFLRRLRPLILGSVYERSEILLDRGLASLTPAGGLSLLYLAQQIWGAAGQVISQAIAAPTFPTLARSASQGGWAQYRNVVRTRLMWVCVVTTAAVGGAALVGRPLLALVLTSRNVTLEDIRLLWVLLLLLGGFLIGNSSGHLLLTSFYATGDTVTPTRIGVVSYTMGAVCKLTGFWLAGLPGLAAGTSAFYMLRSLMLHHALNRRTPHASR